MSEKKKEEEKKVGRSAPLFLKKELQDGERYADFLPYHAFYYVQKGNGVARVGEKESPVKAGDIVFVPQSVRFSFDVKGASVVAVYLSDKYFSDFHGYYPERSLLNFLTDAEKNGRILSVFRAVYGDGLSEYGKVACACAALARIVDEYGIEQRKDEGKRQIDDVVRYIRENYEKDLSLESLAKEFCVSKLALSRKFSRYVGVDFRVFLSDVRIQAFVRLRSDPKSASLSTVELCYRCGFKSYGTFYRAYKRFKGETRE